MKFSIFMMPLHHPTENPSLAFDRDISLIHYAEELGFDEFFIGEHHSGGWETIRRRKWPWQRRRRSRIELVRLGTSVISVPFHYPFGGIPGKQSFRIIKSRSVSRPSPIAPYC